jgi:hypothetical protein
MLSGVASRPRPHRHRVIGSRALTTSELRVLFEEMGEDAVLSQAERQIASRIFEFSSTRAAGVMTPRVDIRSADRRVSPEALAEVIRTSRHARVPISDGSIDRILGFINAKEYLLRPGERQRHLGRSSRPQSKRVSEIFEIQRRGSPWWSWSTSTATRRGSSPGRPGRGSSAIYGEYRGPAADRPGQCDRYLVTGQVAVGELSGGSGSRSRPSPDPERPGGSPQ